MTNYHIINASTKIVENSVEWDGDTNKWAPLDGFVAIASTVSGIGWKYNSEGVGIGTTSGDTNNMWIPQIGYGTTI
tara:strand:+ start:1571 stop:1798 length:228 start_codon:yes stop_codon:yes gene_type:complete